MWRQLIRKLKYAFPEAAVLLSSIVLAMGQLRKTVQISSAALLAVCSREKVSVVDLTNTFTARSGAPRKDLYRDQVHPSDSGTSRLVFNLQLGTGTRHRPAQQEHQPGSRPHQKQDLPQLQPRQQGIQTHTSDQAPALTRNKIPALTRNKIHSSSQDSKGQPNTHIRPGSRAHQKQDPPQLQPRQQGIQTHTSDQAPALTRNKILHSSSQDSKGSKHTHPTRLPRSPETRSSTAPAKTARDPNTHIRPGSRAHQKQDPPQLQPRQQGIQTHTSDQAPALTRNKILHSSSQDSKGSKHTHPTRLPRSPETRSSTAPAKTARDPNTHIRPGSRAHQKQDPPQLQPRQQGIQTHTSDQAPALTRNKILHSSSQDSKGSKHTHPTRLPRSPETRSSTAPAKTARDPNTHIRPGSRAHQKQDPPQLQPRQQGIQTHTSDQAPALTRNKILHSSSQDSKGSHPTRLPRSPETRSSTAPAKTARDPNTHIRPGSRAHQKQDPPQLQPRQQGIQTHTSDQAPALTRNKILHSSSQDSKGSKHTHPTRLPRSPETRSSTAPAKTARDPNTHIRPGSRAHQKQDPPQLQPRQQGIQTHTSDQAPALTRNKILHSSSQDSKGSKHTHPTRLPRSPETRSSTAPAKTARDPNTHIRPGSRAHQKQDPPQLQPRQQGIQTHTSDQAPALTRNKILHSSSQDSKGSKHTHPTRLPRSPETRSSTAPAKTARDPNTHIRPGSRAHQKQDPPQLQPRQQGIQTHTSDQAPALTRNKILHSSSQDSKGSKHTHPTRLPRSPETRSSTAPAKTARDPNTHIRPGSRAHQKQDPPQLQPRQQGIQTHTSDQAWLFSRAVQRCRLSTTGRLGGSPHVSGRQPQHHWPAGWISSRQW